MITYVICELLYFSEINYLLTYYNGNTVENRTHHKKIVGSYLTGEICQWAELDEKGSVVYGTVDGPGT